MGNGEYVHSASLKNPPNDARAMTKELEKLGFKVIPGVNMTKVDMDRVIGAFSARASGADLAVFFYAGHGMQINYKNYLVPIDFNPEDDSYLIEQLVELDRVLYELEKEERTSIVFMDACRDNPLTKVITAKMSQGRSLLIDKDRGVGVVGRGLAEVKGNAGTLIAYATQPGNIALDGTGRHSPFTEAILKYIDEPGLEIRAMLTKVRSRVMRKTRKKQIPWDHSSLIENVYFKKKKKFFAPPP